MKGFGSWRLRLRGAALAAMLLGAFARWGEAAEALRWDAKANRVSADIEGWKLSRLLGEVAAATNWEIFVEPDTEHAVSGKFTEQPAGEALRRLLGKLNFALLPQTNAPARLFIYRTSLQEATQRVPPVKPRTGRTGAPIANELIVTLKPGADINDIARRIGAKVAGGIDGLDAYRLQWEDEAAARTARELLAGYGDVADIDANYYVERPPGAELLAASSGTPFTLNPSVGGDGSRLVVGLIDTPIQREGSPIAPLLLDGLSVFGGDGSVDGYQPTHGTSMANSIGQGLASILKDAATTVRLLPVDVYGNNLNATTFDVAHGIVLAIQNGATVINLSLGSEGNSALLQTVVQNAANKGVVLVAAAGNAPVTTPFYPAAYPEVFATTAGDRYGNIASYANRGDFVDVVAPGVNIVYYNGRAYFVSGTSTAAAYVSGLVAGIASQAGVSVQQAKQRVGTVLSPTAAKK